jgi:hypothetical protein
MRGGGPGPQLQVVAISPWVKKAHYHQCGDLVFFTGFA